MILENIYNVMVIDSVRFLKRGTLSSAPSSFRSSVELQSKFICHNYTISMMLYYRFKQIASVKL